LPLILSSSLFTLIHALLHSEPRKTLCDFILVFHCNSFPRYNDLLVKRLFFSPFLYPPYIVLFVSHRSCSSDSWFQQDVAEIPRDDEYFAKVAQDHSNDTLESIMCKFNILLKLCLYVVAFLRYSALNNGVTLKSGV